MLQPVAKPAKDEWGTPLQAVKVALDLEKAVNASLLELHKLAGEMTDPHMCDFIETQLVINFLDSLDVNTVLIIRLPYLKVYEGCEINKNILGFSIFKIVYKI